MEELLRNIQDNKQIIASLDSNVKNTILKQMAKALIRNCDFIIKANNKDMIFAQASNLNDAMLDRLMLNKERINAMAFAIEKIANLQNPIGNIISGWTTPNGLKIHKVSIPIGVIGIIYESRPNVTSDTAALCFKSGNICLLKGGKEAENSNIAIVQILQSVLKLHNLPIQLISLFPDTSREGVAKIIKQNKFIDLIIPRGSEQLIQYISENSTIPIVKHDKGLCHIFIDKNANPKIAIDICINAKCQRPGVCNAMETLLIHKDIANMILPPLHETFNAHKTILKGCELTQRIITVENATEEDYYTEYLANILSIKVVNNVEEAILHIQKYGSGHSEAIISEDYNTIELFLNLVDSACVYVNASTRFTDGEEFGFGAEVGISTNKLHARGPMGISDLTTYKYKIYGRGHIR